MAAPNGTARTESKQKQTNMNTTTKLIARASIPFEGLCPTKRWYCEEENDCDILTREVINKLCDPYVAFDLKMVFMGREPLFNDKHNLLIDGFTERAVAALVSAFRFKLDAEDVQLLEKEYPELEEEILSHELDFQIECGFCECNDDGETTYVNY